MARAKSAGNGRREEALATLIQTRVALMHIQASFLARAAENDARMAEIDRRIDERFARIEAQLIENTRLSKALPDAIRDKIGFKPPGS
jgi:hypothetical protein